MTDTKHIPQTGEGLHGETMGAPQPEPGVQRAIEKTASQDGGDPDTTERTRSPLERLSQEQSVSELAANSQNKYGMGRQ